MEKRYLRTIRKRNYDELEEEVNTFCETHDVKAWSITHVVEPTDDGQTEAIHYADLCFAATTAPIAPKNDYPAVDIPNTQLEEKPAKIDLTGWFPLESYGKKTYYGRGEWQFYRVMKSDTGWWIAEDLNKVDKVKKENGMKPNWVSRGDVTLDGEEATVKWK